MTKKRTDELQPGDVVAEGVVTAVEFITPRPYYRVTALDANDRPTHWTDYGSSHWTIVTEATT